MIQNITNRINLYVDSFILLKPLRSDYIYSEELINKIKNLINEVLEKNLPFQKLSSDLGYLTKDWSRDWTWIAHHIVLDHINYKKAVEFLSDNENALVFKSVFKEDCESCKSLYLQTSENETNKDPKIFKLTELITNGNNLDPKYFFESEIKGLKPVVGVSIFGFNNEFEKVYYDYSILSLFKDDLKNSRLERSERKPIRITVKGKDYFV